MRIQILSTLQGTGCQDSVAMSVISLTHFENRPPSCSFPTQPLLRKETQSLTSVNSVRIAVLGTRLQRASQTWETAFLFALVPHGWQPLPHAVLPMRRPSGSHVLSGLVPGFSEQPGVAQAGARLGWFCDGWGLDACPEMNGTPPDCPVCAEESSTTTFPTASPSSLFEDLIRA